MSPATTTPSPTEKAIIHIDFSVDLNSVICEPMDSEPDKVTLPFPLYDAADTLFGQDILLIILLDCKEVFSIRSV